METTKITTIDSIEDLNKEKAQLRNEVEYHRKSISSDIEAIRNDLSPVRRVARMAGGMFRSPETGNNNLVRVVAGTAVDLVLYRFFLRRSPLLVKFIVPVLVKNLLGGYVDRNQARWAEKLSGSMHDWRESRRSRRLGRLAAERPHPDNDAFSTEAYLPAPAQPNAAPTDAPMI